MRLLQLLMKGKPVPPKKEEEVLALNISKSYDPESNNVSVALQESWVLSPHRASNVKFIVGFTLTPDKLARRIVGVVKASDNKWNPENPELAEDKKRKRPRFTFNPIPLDKEYSCLIGMEFAKDRCSNPVRYFPLSKFIKK